jgi:hypothetical protein
VPCCRPRDVPWPWLPEYTVHTAARQHVCGSGTETMASASRPSPSRHGGFGRDPRRRRVYYYYYLHGASPAKAHLQAAPALNSPSRPSSRGDIYVAGVSGRSMELEAPGPGLTCPPRRAALAPRVRSRSSSVDTASPRHRPRGDREATSSSSRPSTVWGSRACTQNCRCSKGSRSRTSPEISPQD